MKLANVNSARSCACLSLFMSPLLLCCGGLGKGLSVPLTAGVPAEDEARRVLGFWPDHALGAGGCDGCCLFLLRVVVSYGRGDVAPTGGADTKGGRGTEGTSDAGGTLDVWWSRTPMFDAIGRP